MAPSPAFAFRAPVTAEKASSPLPTLSMDCWRTELARSFRPILLNFVLPCSLFYIFLVIFYAFREPFDHFLPLGSMAGIVALCGGLISFRLSRPKIGFVALELYALGFFLVVYASLVQYHLLHVEVSKLSFFALLAMGIAATGISLRIIVPMALLSLGTSVWLSSLAGYETMMDFLATALAGAFAAFSLAVLLRRAIHREVRARIRAEQLHEASLRTASLDFLTGLPNRRTFFGRLEQAFAGPSETSPLVLALIDINGFRRINDVYGHVIGDQLLTSLSRRISATCSECALVARLDGDEFAILIDKPVSETVLRKFGETLCAEIGEEFDIAGNEITISATIGFARRLTATTAPEHLYEQADFALYRAKQTHDSDVEVFSAADASELETLKKIEHHLSGSGIRNEMHIEYQPMVRVTDNHVIGFEGLARWYSPELGRVRPDIFIRAAERRGIIGRLTPVLLSKALADARNWPDDLRLSFNLSAHDVVSEETIDEICHIVEQSDFPGDRIDFEITETAIMTDFERVRDSLKRLRAHGAHIALDDFGVGYSNFQHLDELMIDKVKIDRRFVSTMDTHENSARIVKTMIDLCSNLGLTCVVEGVETERELGAVMKAGATIVQGYLFSRPMTNDNVVPFLAHTPEPPSTSLRASA